MSVLSMTCNASFGRLNGFNYKVDLLLLLLLLLLLDHWGDPDVDGRIILRWIFRKWEGVKRQERGVDHQPPHLTPRLKKEYSCTSTSPLGLRGLF